jgi:hydroxyacylglutathione hydrolase
MVVTQSSEVVRFRVSRGALVNHCYVVVDRSSRECVFVDPAWDAATLVDFVSRSGLTPKGVLVTHHHVDHVDLAQEMSSRYDCGIYLSEIEYNYYGVGLKRVILLRDEVAFTLANLPIVPIVTPGHTAGSVCYRIGDSLFTGDTLFNEGCGVCMGDGANPIQLYASLQRLKVIVPGASRVYPGHQFHSELGLTFEQISGMNLYLQFDRADGFVRFRMRNAQTRLMSFL